MNIATRDNTTHGIRIFSILDHSVLPVIRFVSSIDKEGDSDTFRKETIYYDLVNSHLSKVPFDCCQDLAADIELTPINDTPLNANPEFVDMTNYPPPKLPELDKDTLSEALNELEKFTSLQPATEAEGMKTENTGVHEDSLSPYNIPFLHNIYSLKSLEDLANIPEWEDVLLQQDSLMEQFVEMVDVSL